jgi:hypothetical protein
MTDVTRLLTALEHGDPHAACRLLPLGYEELRKLDEYASGELSISRRVALAQPDTHGRIQ